MNQFPTIVLHDVLQSTFFSYSQLDAIKTKNMFKWFEECIESLEGQRIKLAVVAEGIPQNPEWVQMIKDGGWEVQCHGFYHHEMHRLSEELAYVELTEARDLLEETFNQKITQFYPMRHKHSVDLFKAATRADMSLIVDKWRPIHVLESNMVAPEIYIHFWNQKNIRDAIQMIEKLR